ncbi:MAG: glycosyltransferase [Planctomycetaceae bacterium]|nr:glycosyltransferase [Planctomycetaceae bacterium]
MIAGCFEKSASLVVFSDDWGRHPSSCQHLIGRLLSDYHVLWVNTIGTRTPKFDLATLKRVGEKLKHWTSGQPASRKAAADTASHEHLTVANPRMWPWFTRSGDRRLNRWLLAEQLTPLIQNLPQPVTALTTLPITADLVGCLPVEQWVYYCVDDFGEWPGLDGQTLRDMDVQMIQRADRIIAVSEHLQSMIGRCHRNADLLTHGVDMDFWQADSEHHDLSKILPEAIRGPLAVFWGVVDRRLDSELITTLSQRMPNGTILLVGPHQDPDDRLLKLPNVLSPGPLPFSALPSLAAAADVLIMPYADLPVTRAMQPLKMKEYMATGRPVVVSSLPAVAEWNDCLDVARDPADFARLVLQRCESGVPDIQLRSRRRLRNESWQAKANALERHIFAAPMDRSRKITAAPRGELELLHDLSN